MRVDRALFLAGTVVSFAVIIALTSLWAAALLEETDGFLAGLARAQAVGISIVFVLTTAAMAVFVCRVLTRQPDDVSPYERERRRLYRERVHGAIVYQNTASISGPAMIIHPHDQTPPQVQCTPEDRYPAGQQPLLVMSPTLEAVEGSLEDTFHQNRGDGRKANDEQSA